MNVFSERILRKIVSNKSSRSVFAKLVPNYYQYKPNSTRTIQTNEGISFVLDISDIIDWFIYFGFHETSKEELLAFSRKAETIIDVGANVGEISLRMANQKNESAAIYAFEPDPTNHKRLLKNLSLNPKLDTIHPIQMGLGDKVAKVNLLTETINNRGRNKVVSSYNKDDLISTIDITTLDIFVSEQTIDKVDFIKIDVEGYELKVLKGGINTIKRDCPTLFIEVDDNNLMRQNDSAKEIISLLINLNYRISRADTGEEINLYSNFVNCHFDIVATK